MNVPKVIETLVRRYTARYPYADKDDLGQVAWEAAERARRVWRADGGAQLTSYVWTAVNTALWREVVWEWSPVHAGSRKATQLLLTQSVQFDTELHDHGHVPAQDQLLDKARAFRRLREVIAAQPDGESALAYLLGDEPARVAAARFGMRPAALRRAAKAACEAVSKDEGLRDAIRDM